LKKKYFDELSKAMHHLSKKNNTIFLGQAVEVPGTAMSNTLKNISKNKLYEFPVAEEMQMGVTLGLAMDGFVPISIYPRWNFLLLAVNQLVNHLDKYSVMNNSKMKPNLIIRTGIGSVRPLFPQVQHVGDFSDAISRMTKKIEIIKLKSPNKILANYKKAYLRRDGKFTILVEYGDYYNEK
jgi:pyruvate/2-oxoglutarate/acetoin dehydrogenase E1 component